MLKKEIPDEVIRQIKVIFDSHISNEISNNKEQNFLFQHNLLKLRDHLIAYIKRQCQTVITITRQDTEGDFLSALQFVTPHTNPQEDSKIEIVISNTWDAFTVYDTYRFGDKKEKHHFKI